MTNKTNIYWKQYDSEYNNKKAWPKSKFPNSTSEYFKDIGCFIFSIAAGIKLKGVVGKDFTPWDFHKKILEADLYSSSANFAYWLIDKIYPIKALWTKKFSKRLLQESLNQGLMCILEVKGTNYPFHYILATKQTEDDILIYDSNSKKNKLSSFEKCFKITTFEVI